MNTLNGHSRLLPDRWGQYSSMLFSLKSREYELSPFVYRCLLSDKYLNEPKDVIESKIINMDDFCKEMELPAFITKYYPEIKHNFVGKKPLSKDNIRRSYCIVICEDLKRFEIDMTKTEEVINLIKDIVPTSIVNISKDTVERFLHILPENEGKYDISDIHFLATQMRCSGAGWSESVTPTKFIVVDRFMNPIDIDKFMDVIKKIVVEKDSASS